MKGPKPKQAATAAELSQLREFLAKTAGVKHLWSAKEIAALLEIHPRTWRKWHKAARVAATVPVNQCARWSPAAVVMVCEAVAARQTGPTPPPGPPTPYPRPRTGRGNVATRYG